MPTHTFENDQGHRCEFIAPMGTLRLEADGVTWSRIQEPEGFQIPRTIDFSQKEDMRRGYYKHESKGWSSKFSKNQVKKAWDL